jgi:CHAT domain-containing protein
VSGTQTVVASLWQVPDQPTQVLMEQFYSNLWQKKMSKLEALRAAQLWMLREGKTHPGVARGMEREDAPKPDKTGRLPAYYWAAFMMSGVGK